MPLNRRRAVPAAFLAAAVAAGISACGSAGGGSAGAAAASSATPSAGATAAPSPTASKDPLAGLSAGQTMRKALNDTETAQSVTFSMITTDSGRKLTVDFAIVRGKGCEGTMTENGQGSFKVVYDGKTTWFDGDKQFWQANYPSAASALTGKYVKASTNTLTNAFAPFCGLKKLLAGFGTPPDGAPETHTTMNGGPAIEIKDTGDKAAIYLSDVPQPVVLKVTDPGSGGGTMTFTRYDATAALTYPPASDVVDGSQYGL